MDLISLAIGLWIGGIAVYAFMRGVARTSAGAASATAAAPASAEDTTPQDASAQPAIDPAARTRAYALAKELEEAYQQADRGSDLELEPRFNELVDLVASSAFDTAQRLAWVPSQTMPLSCASLAAMARAGDERRPDVARMAGNLGHHPLHFALAYLRGGDDPQVCGLVLLRASYWWPDYPAMRDALRLFLDDQHARGVVPAVPAELVASGWDLDERRDLLRQMPHPLIEDFLVYLAQLDRTRRGQREIANLGRLIAAGAGEDSIAMTPPVREAMDTLLEALRRPSGPSFVIVGPPGAGKTTIAHAALRALAAEGWRVLEASPSQLLAGQTYIGQMEQRIENLVAGIGGEKALWFVPECHQLLEQGMSSGNRTGLLDRLLPYLERGQLQLLGESSIEAWSRVVAARPRVESLVTGLKVQAMSDGDGLQLAKEWARLESARLGEVVIGDGAVAEAAELARQQYPQRVEPGRTMELLKDALAAATARAPMELPIERGHLLEALARRSGLPIEILDTGTPLDVGAVRDYFQTRVIGQEEAVDTLVDRISMLKAGLTDPKRPIGVFLFAGPTGTGKTEIAKTLASYLFGSPDRMLRVDMSEFQSEDSQWRLLGDHQEGGTSLTARVRQQPFSVILLDEFEKAHPRIWDLFLQVFDDGRLTDRGGNTADFRHCIIILTSNLGATIDRGGGAGFVASRGGFSREQVERSIEATFRREFVNRLDRVVVFRPLTRALMRDILEKELRGVLSRRGFRSRDWAVEWEPSAVEFLLERGFTPDLGARPLRRAIDQYLLAPLSRTIVEHRVPSGEQFLFVQADAKGLQVRFVDPDASPAAPAPAAPAGTAADLRSLALDPRAGADTLAVLEREIGARERELADESWLSLKTRQAAEMQDAGFWQRGDRHAVLDRLERIDRIEAGLRSASALRARLARSNGRGAADLVRRLALLVTSLERAIASVLHDEPEDARLELRPADARSAQSLAWRDRLAEMYARWAEARGIRVQRQGADAASGCLLLDFSGFGAWRGLRGEAGTHVLEMRMGDTDLRQSVRVSVRPVAGQVLPPEDPALESRVCRRYDDGPAPLVRDTARGWRSGRLERVLAGDFDLIGEG
jgi:ATP-dependent Clp protease ATP-binding subunit ClpC